MEQGIETQLGVSYPHLITRTVHDITGRWLFQTADYMRAKGNNTISFTDAIAALQAKPHVDTNDADIRFEVEMEALLEVSPTLRELGAVWSSTGASANITRSAISETREDLFIFYLKKVLASGRAFFR